jgi:hypothetical protein
MITPKKKESVAKKITKILFALILTVFIVMRILALTKTITLTNVIELSSNLLAIGTVVLIVSYVLGVYKDEK